MGNVCKIKLKIRSRCLLCVFCDQVVNLYNDGLELAKECFAEDVHKNFCLKQLVDLSEPET